MQRWPITRKMPAKGSLMSKSAIALQILLDEIWVVSLQKSLKKTQNKREKEKAPHLQKKQVIKSKVKPLRPPNPHQCNPNPPQPKPNPHQRNPKPHQLNPKPPLTQNNAILI